MQKQYSKSTIDFTNEEEFYQHLDKRNIRYYEYRQSIHMTLEWIFGETYSDEVFWQKIKLSNKINNCNIYCNLCKEIDFNAIDDIKIYMSI